MTYPRPEYNAAATAGAGFGLLFVATGSLVAPAAAHGIYNLVALVYLRRRSNRQDVFV